MKPCVKPIAAAVLFAAFAVPALADTATWSFDLPSTALPSQTPPYPSLATLTLTDVAGGVQFVLDPDASNPGYTSTSTVNRVDYVYSGPALTDAAFQYDSGATIKTASYESGSSMDSGYAAHDQHIIVNFFTDPQNEFVVNNTSTWTVLGTTLDDFVNTFATSNSKPSPIAAVISVDPFHNPDLTPNPSNWVVGVAEIPEPETYAMLLAGLGMLGFVGKRRCKNQPPADDLGPTARLV